MHLTLPNPSEIVTMPISVASIVPMGSGDDVCRHVETRRVNALIPFICSPNRIAPAVKGFHFRKAKVGKDVHATVMFMETKFQPCPRPVSPHESWQLSGANFSEPRQS